MSSSETTDQRQVDRRLAVWLVAAHLVVGLLLGGITRATWNESDPNLMLAVFFGFAFAQAAGLLGVWLAYANRPLLLRFVVVPLGVGYLGMLIAVRRDAIEFSILYLTMCALGCIPVTAILYMIRCFGVGLHHGGIRQDVTGAVRQ